MKNIIKLTEKTKRDGSHKAWVYSLDGKVLRTSGRPDPFPFGFLYPKHGEWTFGQKPDSSKVKYQGEPTVYTVITLEKERAQIASIKKESNPYMGPMFVAYNSNGEAISEWAEECQMGSGKVYTEQEAREGMEIYIRDGATQYLKGN